MKPKYEIQTYYWVVGNFYFILVDNFIGINLIKNWQCRDFNPVKTNSSIGVWKLKIKNNDI